MIEAIINQVIRWMLLIIVLSIAVGAGAMALLIWLFS